MTRNYLTLMSNIETHRSNVANETELNRHNVTTERETKRHNVSVEQETNRHNLVMEEQGWENLAEIARHNYATEKVAYGQLQLGYDNLAETSRHNRAYEVIQTIGANAAASQAVSAQLQAQAAQVNAGVNRFAAQKHAENQARQTDIQERNWHENQRHNLATEGMTRDYNVQHLQLEGIKTYAEAAKDYSTMAKNISSSANDVLKVIATLKFAH